jgi:hypothetical protein
MGLIFFPLSVSEYSTVGGTVGYALRFTMLFSSKALSFFRFDAPGSCRRPYLRFRHTAVEVKTAVLQ